MKEIAEHVAVVTGGSRGIGKAIVRRLAAEGAALVINARSEAAANDLATELRNAGQRAVPAVGDVSNPEDVRRIFETCRAEFGDCTLLVNNAGHEDQAPFEELTVEHWDRMIAVHLRGTFLCCRAAIGGMLAAGEGVIINMASRRGQMGGLNVSHYSTAKAGIIGLTKSLAREFSGRGVRVNAVAPGPITTEISEDFAEGWEEDRMKELPLGMFGVPDDVADTVAFLASPRSRLYVGQTFSPNSGGLMLG